MKRTILFIAIIFIGLFTAAKAQNNYVCRLGFTYFISMNDNWGKNKPVIDRVYAYSPAEQAGLKPYDIIEVIDGIPIEQIAYNEIPGLLNPAGTNEVVISISNLGVSNHQVIIKKDCIKSNAILEDQLASAFNMYSLESTVDRDFTCPFKTTVSDGSVDLSRFKTYKFSTIHEDNRALETAINDAIETELAKKGMRKDNNNPDVLIHTYYFFDKNPNFRGQNILRVSKEPVYRYNIGRKEFEEFPFLSPSTAESEAAYLLQLGIRIIDQVDVPGRVLWECEANEMMENSYRLDDYARIHIPLMCMQYPYVTFTRNVSFLVSKKAYNYTGISYDIDRLELVADVSPSSPAYAAGIRAGDVIERIGKHRMNHSVEEFTNSYKQFILRTMNLRNPNTQFTDANGFSQCMLWDTFKYLQVAEAIQKNEYNSAFSYLYYFAPYINSTGGNAITFSIKRGKDKQDVVIRPTIRTEVTIEVK